MAENLPANMVAARAANEAAAAKTPTQMNPATTTVGASNSQFPVEFGNSLPGLVNKTAAGVQNTAPTVAEPNYAAPTAEQFGAMNAVPQTIGGEYAQGVRNKDIIGSFQNVGDQGTPGGTSATTTGTGTIVDQNTPAPIETPTPTEPTTAKTTEPAQMPIVNDIAATTQNTSTIVEAARSFGTQLNDFTKNFSGTMKDFMDNQTNAYTSLSNDMRALMETSIGAQKTMTEQYVTNLNKLSESMVSQQNASIAAAQKNADTLTQFALDDKKLALAQNDIASKQSASNYANQIEMAQDNQSRYLGYLTGQFAAAGMTGGSAALQLTGKYLAAGQMAINALGQEAQNTALMYITKGTQIMSESAKSMWQIEAQRIDATNKLQSETTDKLLSIENNKFSASSKQLSDSYTAIKDYNNSRIDIQSKSFNELMQIHNASMDEAKFAYQQVQDLIQQDQWTKTFDRSGQQFEKTFGLQEKQENRALDAQMTNDTGNLYINGQDTGLRALPGKTFDQNVKEFERQGDQWNKTFNRGVFESNRTFTQSADQFNKTFGISQDSNNRANAEFIMKAATPDENGNYWNVSLKDATSSSFNGAKAKYNPVATPDGGVQFNVKSGTKSSTDRNECGEFVNDALGLSGGEKFTNTIGEKSSKVSTQIATPGSAFVQDTGSKWGHVGIIESTGKFDAQGRPTELGFVDSNYSKDGDGRIRRGVMTVSYDAQGNASVKRDGKPVNVVGFTDGILPNKTIEQPRGQNAAFGPQPAEGVIDAAKIQETKKAQPQTIQMGNMTLTKNTDATGTTNALPSEVQNTVGRLTTNLTKDKRKAVTTEISRLANNGDTEGLKSYVKQLAIDTLPSAKQTDYYDFGSVADNMGRLQKTINMDSSSGLYAKLANDQRKWAGLDQDSSYRDLFGQVMQAQAQYRKALSGTSVTPGEAEAGKMFFINPEDKVADVMWKVGNMAKFSQDTMDSITNRAMGVTSNTSTAQSKTVTMVAPDGRTVYIPSDQVDAALKAGAKRS